MWNDGTKYIGQFLNGAPHGRGKLILDNCDTYEGEWKNDQASGYGCLITSTKSYTGRWLNDVYEGEGEEKWKDGSTYKGEFKNGLKHGYGVYKWSDSTTYSGNWKDN